jgi:hypothetical protein
MRIAIDTNGVLRDTLGKAEQVYQKFFIDDYIKEEGEGDFEYKLNLPVNSMNLIEHFVFPKTEDLYDFFYVDFPMNIFGHAASISGNTFNIVNEIYEDLRDDHEISIISDEIQKSKPATLFFLSKYGCLVENINFYSKITMDKVISDYDIIVTANPDILSDDSFKLLKVKFNTPYNQNIKSDYTITNLEEFKELYEELKLKENV